MKSPQRFARHLAEQTKDASGRVARRRTAMRRLEETRANYKAAIGQGHINPTILESRTETEAQPASLAAETAQEGGNLVEFPPDLRKRAA